MNISRAIAVISLFLSFILFSFWIWIRFPLSEEFFFESYGQMFVDRNFRTIFFNTSSDGKYLFREIDISEIPLSFIEAVLVREDDNFFAHGAVDVPAVFRAFFQNIFAGKVVSGASTITEQLAKKILKNTDRTLRNKLREVILALRLEAQFSKEEIFAMWTNRAPFSGNIVGLSAASQFYFNKPASSLSLAQSAYLASIPKNPTRYSPWKGEELLQKRKEDTLKEMHQHGFISSADMQAALLEEIVPSLSPPPLLAPHLTLFLRSSFSDAAFIQLSLDMGLQEKVEGVVIRYLDFLKGHGVKNAATIVVENKTGAVRAYVGNTNYSAKKNGGKVDILRSFRQVGSTLKPFVYYLAFRDLGWTPETEILDEPIGFDSSLGTTFSPKNFDLAYRGKITVRQALAESRNIPAVSALAQVGEEKFKDFLTSLGVQFLQREDDSGLSASLGASEIQLLDLAKLYALLAREGEEFFFCFVGVCPEQHGRQVLDKKLVQELTDILSDNTARVTAFGENSPLAFSFPVAAKTGTTRNFRDNFTVGFTTEYTVLVWIGNADGSPMKEVSGISGAGPIFHDILQILSTVSKPKNFSLPDLREKSPDQIRLLRILSPLQNSEYKIDFNRPLVDQKIIFESTLEADFFVDGKSIGYGKSVFWIPKIGKHTLLVRKDDFVQTRDFFVVE